MRPVRPGEILRKEYLVPLNMGAHALTEKFGVTQARINEIVEGQRSITPELA
ncbi:MAG: HigA family addiction module antidote protein [Polaromonas sp.]|nr:HigA family addiction module antidote protein [Polaromonas sp.]